MTARRKVAVVTGSGSGIGAATVDRLATDGFQVAGIDMVTRQGGPELLSVIADVSDESQVKEAFEQVLSEFGAIDVLVNNAGITGGPAATVCHETSLEDWERIMAVNVRGPFLCARAALEPMLAQQSGHIITIASVAGLVAFPGRCGYTTSKGAAISLTRSLAVDYASSGIRANAVCPGMVETPMTQWRLDEPDLRKQIEGRIPLGHVAQPGDVAEAVATLAGQGLAYMTGHTLVLDGGWTAQ